MRLPWEFMTLWLWESIDKHNWIIFLSFFCICPKLQVYTLQKSSLHHINESIDAKSSFIYLFIIYLTTSYFGASSFSFPWFSPFALILLISDTVK